MNAAAACSVGAFHHALQSGMVYSVGSCSVDGYGCWTVLGTETYASTPQAFCVCFLSQLPCLTEWQNLERYGSGADNSVVLSTHPGSVLAFLGPC
jgi:hypothetical protein